MTMPGASNLVILMLLPGVALVLRRQTEAASWTCLAIVAARVLAAVLLALNSDAADRPKLVAAVDLAAFAALVWVALRSRRHYPLILAAAGLIAVVAHGLALGGLIASVAALEGLLAATACAMLLALVIGARTRRSGPDAASDNFPAGSACPGSLNR